MNGESDDGSNADEPEGPDADGPDTDTGDEREEANPPEWTEKHWLKSSRGRKLFAADIALTIVLGIILATIAVTDTCSNTLDFEVTLWTITGFALMGGFGYLYTPFFKNIDRPAGDVVKYNFRLVGTIPLAFAVVVLSEPVFQVESIGTLALAFIAGFSVNAFYTAISDIADRVFPTEENRAEATENGSNNQE